jgi:hypothetical protein
MICSQCKKTINGTAISFVDEYFCSPLCHIRYWKIELPNLGGDFISNNDLTVLSGLSPLEQKDESNRIIAYILKNFKRAPFIQLLE